MFAALVWNPDPIIVQLGGFALRWYSLLFATGFIISFFILRRRFIEEKVSLDILDKFLLYSVVGTILGARLGNCFFYDFDYFSQHPLEILLPFRFSPEFEFVGFRGLASHGALLGLLAAYWLLARQTGQTIRWFLDKGALVAGLCLASIRLGNFMNGEIAGAPTDLPWAIIFPNVDQLPRHPVQLYGFVVYLGLFFFMGYYNKRIQKRAVPVQQGHLLGVFLLILGSLRFCMEFIKRHYVLDPDSWLNMAQWLSIPLIIGGAILAWYTSRSTPTTIEG